MCWCCCCCYTVWYTIISQYIIISPINSYYRRLYSILRDPRITYVVYTFLCPLTFHPSTNTHHKLTHTIKYMWTYKTISIHKIISYKMTRTKVNSFSVFSYQTEKVIKEWNRFSFEVKKLSIFSSTYVHLKWCVKMELICVNWKENKL